MRYTVHGATGAQGSPVVSALTAAGAEVSALTRDHQTSIPGVETVVADLASSDSLARAYGDADGVFVHLPAAPDEVLRPMARNIAAALRTANPARVVISTSGRLVSSPQGQDAVLSSLIAGVAEAGISHAVIEPRLFFENLLMPPLVEAVRGDGVLRYPIREDISISWASHLDIADAAVELLVNKTRTTGIVGLGQLSGITGKDLAAAYSTYLGREVVFEAVVPAEFGKNIASAVGEAAAAGVVALYQGLWEAPAHVIDDATSAQQKLGLTPRTTEQWLTDMSF
ncbi:NmrA family NAD(P)-binding protein [Promicromonospora sp. NPDC023805]|uniref:SDR family oxidoreductase n=1 Tax=Promicromonospora sp. NPDC023805 TaxID=3154696 RepID=UPI0033BFCE82